MHSSLIVPSALQALCFLAGFASAQTDGFDAITRPTKNESITAGSTTHITWEYDDKWPGDITITLIGGSSPSTLSPVDNLTSNYDNSKGDFTWAVDKSLGEDATYGIQIYWNTNSSVFQWSNPFHIVASKDSGSSVASPKTSVSV
ncbi:hypothetical protein M406DRAFT_70065 [Cryphonectria parasitica EP155]|uniref:Yeast cell wall synthesis Kre9/Knh1-like N-terminal domain-containing protein n=1 Tax=Cryphonectria parasitica (strain ATCC 38755 / EP155) TaxID=660469 RepID=A0A9P4Y7M2_CRYP1|nr:uncharacterized protein M406DRAFT_70065 [Cryphonectria parasitica EP155]KAF3767965.1 hypothetical protein M406DRAFT_70065 [Cryphonectria parasitica EP155]